jgi:hypothetical protein
MSVMPIDPPAPGRFTTVIGRVTSFWSFKSCATVRPKRSTPPPGANGIVSSMFLLG